MGVFKGIVPFVLMLGCCFGSVQATWPASATTGHVNHTVPKVTAPTEMSFSSPPVDAEFLRTGLFAEPLAPVAATTPEENRSLAQALFAYREAARRTGAIDAGAPLLDFIAAHPKSAWTPALQLDLGIIYRRTGHFSKALEVWQSGWSGAQSLSDPHGRTLANAIVARLSQLEAYLGRKELLAPLLDSIQNRSVGGTAAQLLTDSHTGLYEMVYHPEESFRCGPLALERILKYGDSQPSALALKVLQYDSPSTDHGLSLSNVEEIAQRAGMDYQAAFRSSGAPMILPAVAHWKVGHYAAIVAKTNDHYVVQDTTFGEDIRASDATLDEESSGYFLVPAGPLPEGWRRVSVEEGGNIWGRGNTGNYHTDDEGCQATAGCTTPFIALESVGSQLGDNPVGYKPPIGPQVQFSFIYSHRDAQQPATFSYTNFGAKWTFTWLSYITDSVNTSASALLYPRGGGSEPFSFGSTAATTAYPGPYSQTTLTRTVNGGGASTSFTLTHPDGSSEVYGQALGSQFFMTAVKDPAGNTVTLTYDASMRITAITDAIGQVTTLAYGNSSTPLVVTKITDPFGRSASFTYNGSGLLASITDVLGITSSYTYGQGSDPDFINTLTTPYGSTSFVYGDVTTNPALGTVRFLKTTDPLGRTSYVEFNENVVPGDSNASGSLINPSLMPTGMNVCNQYLIYRNTYVFDPNEYAQATAGGSLNYALGKVIHWLHSSDLSYASRVKESEKEPLENRVWYNYPAQSICYEFPVSSGFAVTNGASTMPSAIGRVLDSGASQIQSFQYNAQGNVTQSTDPVGRQMTYTYAANGIDRLTASNTTSGTQLLETRTYNSEHLPLTITGANGATAKYQYNANGQPTKFTDQQGHATTLKYDGSGHLKTVTGAISTAVYNFSYDNVSRIESITDPAGATLRYTYDAADRKLNTTYPDGTITKLAYTLLDLTTSTDRLNQSTHYKYDVDRELITITDPLNHVTHQGYNLAGKLASITDPNNHTTTMVLDVESRMTTKQYANGTSMTLTYQDGLSLLAQLTDALNQTTTYTYNTDNTTATISYAATQATASVSFTYDSVYPRVLTMTDGVGTTTYAYNPVTVTPKLGANRLTSVRTPVAGTSNTDVIDYSYDAINRTTGFTVNGVPQLISFDALGRMVSVSNPLDTFVYGHLDGTARVSGVTSSAGPTSAMTYFSPSGDELLEQATITNHSGSATLAQFGYIYDSDENVKSTTTSAPSAQTTAYAYDAGNRLLSGIYSGSTPQYSYGYDAASNLTSITPNGPTQSYAYNSVNDITAGSYDANGSPASLTGKAYKWDGANRIVKFSNTANNTASSFTYDGIGRLVRIVDTHGGAITADHSYTWCGPTRCLAHDNTQANSPVSTQYFAQGVISSGTPYYYIRDRLGSVTALVSNSGSITSQYAYDPYGNRVTLSGTIVSDMGYAGYFYHGVSGFEFALYRAYDPVHARWINRDPIGEAGGQNLYAYVGGRPLSVIDPIGFCPNNDVLESLAWSLQQFRDNILFGLWGGYANFLGDLQQSGWPGGNLQATIAGLGPITGVESAAATELEEMSAAALAEAQAEGRAVTILNSGIQDGGALQANYAINVTAAEAEANLISEGYTASQAGSTTLLANGSNVYSIYAAKSGSVTLQLNNIAAENIVKYRLTGR